MVCSFSLSSPPSIASEAAVIAAAALAALLPQQVHVSLSLLASMQSLRCSAERCSAGVCSAEGRRQRRRPNDRTNLRTDGPDQTDGPKWTVDRMDEQTDERIWCGAVQCGAVGCGAGTCTYTCITTLVRQVYRTRTCTCVWRVDLPCMHGTRSGPPCVPCVSTGTAPKIQH